MFNQYQIKCNQFTPVEINDFRNFDEVKAQAQRALNSQVTACIWILPGPKKAGTNYDRIKRLLINQLPVPS